MKNLIIAIAAISIIASPAMAGAKSKASPNGAKFGGGVTSAKAGTGYTLGATAKAAKGK